MIVGGLATILGAFHPLLGQPVAWVAWLFLHYTIKVVELTARFPLASINLGAFGAGAMWLYYGLFGLAAAAAHVNRGRLRETLSGCTQRLSTKLLLGGLALVAILAWIAAFQMPDGRLHVHFLDVGQGDAIFIEGPQGQQILVDGGPEPSVLLSQLGQRMPFWDHSLDLVVLTHPEVDHVGGLVDVLERYDVGLVLDSGQECASATCEAWRGTIEERGIPYRRAQAGQQIALGEGIRLDVFHPTAQLMNGTSSDTNNNSVVLRLEYGRFSALLTGDVQWEAEELILASGRALHSLVLKVPHHGADTSLTVPFLEAVDPELAVISVGADNTFGHPSAVALDRLGAIPTYRTDEDGAVEVVTDGASYGVHTER
jgi:competence protein ComEC